MNTNLVEYVDSFIDVWDSQGHNTKHTDVICTWSLADAMLDAVYGISELMKSEPNDDTDIEMSCASLVLTCVSEFASDMNVDFGDVFETDDEMHNFIESITDRGASHYYHNTSDDLVREFLCETLEGYFE